MIGAGRVGTAVAELLRRRGHEVVGVASRTASSAFRAAHLLGAKVFDLRSGLPESDVTLLGMPAGDLESVASQLATKLEKPTVVCHFAGSVGIEPLRATLTAGAGVCAMHPVQACPDVAMAIRRLPGSAWGVTCSEGLETWADEVVTEELDGMPVRVLEQDRALWHAAAVVTSNGIGALMSIGESLLSSLEVPSPDRILVPLAAGTVQNAAERPGAAATLTGPVVRGEVETIERHIAALETRAPSLVEAYVLVARAILLAARRAGRLDCDTEQTIRPLLERR